MATKTISLELDAYECLRAAKRSGESFSAVVRRARFGPVDATGKAILSTLEGRAVHPPDLVAVAYWEAGIERRRSSTPSRWGSDEVG